MGKRKNKLMKEFLAREIQVGDRVYIPEKLVTARRDVDDRLILGEVKALPNYNDADPKYLVYVFTQTRSFTFSPKDVIRYTGDVGVNPIPDMPWMKRLQRKMFDVYSIAFRLNLLKDTKATEYDIGGINVNRTDFNPFVTDSDGTKHYFQRDYCWSLADEREFIRSWYKSIQCGTIVIRRRDFKWCSDQIKNGNKEASLFEVVDGKQRLHCLYRFLHDKFSDHQGNLWSDLSKEAQNELLGSQVLGYMELGEYATDHDTIQTFLTINNTGKPMSKEHISKVRAIATKFKSTES